MNSLADEFANSIRERRLLRQGQVILVAVSGGLDSMVLLHLMNKVASGNGWKLIIGHLNHKLRGKSSEADARLVERTAKQLGWRAVIGTANVREIARREKLSLEMAARKARHQFLARTAAKIKIPTIALAHHADDQLELFFLRLFRGSGSQGLQGMKWRSPSPCDKRIELVRPLLAQSRAALAQYAAENEVRFREDASNASVDFQRNRIRHELLPLLRKHYQPALETVIARVLDITQAEADFVTETTLAQANGMRNAERGGRNKEAVRAGLESLPMAVQRRWLQLQLLGQGITPNFDLVEQLRRKENQSICVSPDKLTSRNRLRTKPVYLIRDSKGIVKIANREFELFPRNSAVADLSKQCGEINFGGIQVSWKRKPGRSRKRPAASPNCEWFDAEQVGEKAILRHWQPGDRFHPIGMRLPLKLQDFFTNQGVPRERRHELVLAASAVGEVFWVQGMRISERFKLTKATNRRLQWRWQRL